MSVALCTFAARIFRRRVAAPATLKFRGDGDFAATSRLRRGYFAATTVHHRYQALAKPLPAATINAVLRLPPARRDELCGRRDLNELCRLKIRDLLPPIDAVRVEAFTATTLTLGLVAQTA